jgi:hypothetical protein
MVSIFKPPDKWGGMWFPPYPTISDEEFDLAIGLSVARWYRRFFHLEEEDKQRTIVQGKPLSFWLNKLQNIEKEENK